MQNMKLQTLSIDSKCKICIYKGFGQYFITYILFEIWYRLLY